MFGSSKPVYIESWSRRRKRRVPPWLVLLVVGVAIGVAGVLIVQQRYLPPRLSAEEGTQLRQSFERAESERQRLANELAATGQRLAAALADAKTSADGLAASRQRVDQMRGGLEFMAESLPPDPRGGAVEVRAARFALAGGKLAYDVLLYRDRAAGKPLGGVVQFVLAGDSARGTPTAVTSEPLPVSIGRHESLGGELALPDGFRPKQATVNVLDRAGGKLLGMRVMFVK
jgi:hypothetical protein